MGSTKLRTLATAGAAILLFSHSLLAASPVTQQRLLEAPKDGDEWLAHGRDLNETRFSPLDNIDTANVSRLGLAWSCSLDGIRAYFAGYRRLMAHWERVLPEANVRRIPAETSASTPAAAARASAAP